jgi:hypothetical protein
MISATFKCWGSQSKRSKLSWVFPLRVQPSSSRVGPCLRHTKPATSIRRSSM